MLIVLNMLLSSFSFVAEDMTGIHRNVANLQAGAEKAAVRNNATGEKFLDKLFKGLTALGGNRNGSDGDEIELEDDGADDLDDHLEDIGDLSVSDYIETNAANDSNTYVYPLEEGENRLLLSDLVKQLEMPIEKMKLVESVCLLGNEQDPNIDMSVFVTILAVEDDFVIYLKPGFVQARLAVYTQTDTYTIKLINDVEMTVEEVALAAEEIQKHSSVLDTFLKYDFSKADGKILLSQLLERIELPLKLRNIIYVGVVEQNGDEAQKIDIAKSGKDYIITARESFDEIGLAVCTENNMYIVALLNGRPAGNGGNEADEFGDGLSEVPDGVAAEGTDEVSDEDSVDVPAIESDDDLVIEPNDEPIEVPIDVLIEEPAEDLTGEPTSDEDETPAAETEEDLTSEPTSDEDETPAAESDEEPTEETESDESATPVEESDEEPTEETESDESATPVEESDEEPTEEPESDESATPVEESDEEPTEKPESGESETPAVESDEEPTQESESDGIETPAVETDEETTEKPESDESATPTVDVPAEEQAPEMEGDIQVTESEGGQTELPPEILTDAPEEEPTEEPTEELTDEPTEETIEEPTEELTDEPTEETIGEPIEEPTEEPAEDVTEEPTEKPTEESSEESTEESTEEPTEESSEEVTEEPSEEPTEESTEESTEQSTEEPAEDTTEEPTEETTEEPAEDTTEESHEEITEEPTEESTEESTEEPTEQPTEEPTEEPAEETTEEPTEEPAEETTEEPAEELTEEPTEAPAEESASEPVNYPAQTFEARASGMTITVTADEGAFPEGTTMNVRRVWDADTLSDIRESVAEDFVAVKRVQLVDIAFYDVDGNEIEPLLPVSVVISVSKIADGQEALVVHVDDEGQAQVVTQSDAAETGGGVTTVNVEMPAAETVPGEVETEQTKVYADDATVDIPGDDGAVQLEDGEIEQPGVAEDNALNDEVDVSDVAFEADAFSMYAVVVTEIIETLYIDASGNTWSVEVGYGQEAEIPSGATLRVSELTGEAADDYAAQAAEALELDADSLNYIKALDITIVKDGEPVQPKAPVNVSIRLKDAPETMEENNINVVHFGDEPEVLDFTLNGDTVAFDSDGFSVYVITGNDAIPRCKYTFWVPSDGGYSEYPVRGSDGEAVYSQTVKSIDELVVPQLVSTDTKEFAGWYEGNLTQGEVELTIKPGKTEPEPYDFDNTTITEESAVDLYAVFKEYAYVYFHGQYDDSSRTFPVSSTVREELVTTTEGETTSKTATVNIGDVTASYSSTDDTKMDFYGWSYTPVQTPGVVQDSEGNSYVIEEDSITISGETHLYPIYKTIHWLTYYAAQSGLSATYVAPASFYAGDPVEYNGSFSLPTTARDGYTFLGWWTGTLNSTKVGSDTVETVDYGTRITDADGRLVTSADVESSVYISLGKLYLRRDVTLYAKWEATYNIVYWKQKTNESPSTEDKTYEYAETVSRTAAIGDTVTVEESYRAADRYAGYTFGHCDPPAVIGNTKALTVLNVYYDLSGAYSPAEGGSYTLTFADSVTGSDASEMPAAVTGLSYRASLAGSAPVDPISSRTSESGRAIYSFDRWYADKAATIPVFFTTPTTEERESLDEYVVIDTMPDHDVTVYAGWTPIKFRVDINPNYGALYYYDDEGVLRGTGATYFNNTYDAEPIGEYTHVTRDYVESTSGAYFYVNHDRAYGGSDRYTYYTTKQSEATEDTTFEYSPGTYTYAGWYEVYSDGSEASEPYDFSQHTDHATTLRLHWKKSGAYYLKYNAKVDNLIGTMDDTDKSAELFADGSYADYAKITLAHSAVAPEKYTFVGWKVRGSDSTTIYTPGQSFTLHADDAIRTSGKEVIILDAVYTRVDTASITYDANGGTVSETPDYGSYPSSTGEDPVAAPGTVDTTAGTATVSGLTNNSKFILSSGTGFGYTAEGVTYTLAGWSNQADYDPDDPDAELYTLGGAYGVDSEEPTTLYAVWQTKVTYHLNNTTATWGGTGAEGAWESPYTSEVVSSETVYTLNAYLGNVVDEPPYIPKYTGTDNVLFKYWATKGTDGGTETYMQYDFTQAVTGAPDLYAYWSEPNTIEVHAVDASTETLSKVVSGTDGWTINSLTVGTTSIPLPGSGIVTAPSDYEIAFVAAHDSAKDVAGITEAEAVTAIVYDSAKKAVYVTYADGTSAALQDGAELYYVCYQKKARNIGYKSMAANGELTDVETTGAANTTDALGTCDMRSQIADPLRLASRFSYYAFAIGDAFAADASALSVMTNPAGASDSAPALQVRNTWQGFQYSEDGSTWVSCGYDPTLYVIYFTQQPTTIIFKEKTVGSSSIMDTGFTYNVTVTQTETNESETTTTTLLDTTPASEEQSYHKAPYILKNGEEQSAILFYSSAEDTTTTQTITITQTAENNFDTAVSSEAGTETQPNVWTYTSDGSGETRTVTFTNTHKALPVEVHVAMVNGDGLAIQDGLRSASESEYSFDLALGAEAVSLTTQLSSNALFAGDETYTLDDYAFGAVVYGTSESTDGSPITVQGMGAAKIAYEQINDNVYELVLKDSSGNTIGELGSYNLYYLYYPMPKIRYMEADAAGNLTPITGSVVDPQTGSVVASDSITYDHEAVSINNQTVAYDQNIEIPLSGLTISQSGNNFRMPAVLDDGLLERYLGYTKLGAGSTDITTVGALADSTEDLTMYLRISGNALQFSFDNATWRDLPMSGTPTIYAIYEERGYDLQISKTVDMSNSGTDALFAEKTFTVTIKSSAITKSGYPVTGWDTDTITAMPANGTAPGKIVLNDVMDGTRIRIKGLGTGDYTITETGNDNYILSAKTGVITDTSTSTATVEDDSRLEISLTEGTKVDLTNTPKAICKIGNVKFYTLRSAIAYIETQGSTTTTVEMLTDYLMPSVDTVTIPSGYAVTFTTAEEGFEGAGDKAVIARSEDLADSALFTNNGALAFTNMVLEGNFISSSKPMFQSAGDLTIGASAVVRNAINSGNGGAINATAGNIAVSSGTITGCSSAKGGAIYNSGNGEITVSGTGKLQSNTTSGDGGAIYTLAGTITIAGSSQISGNTAASGNGGAIYAGSAVIDISQNGSLTGNTAKKGGAIYAETGTITVSNTTTTSSSAVLKPNILGNTASDGDGGAIWVGSGSITASGGTWAGNTAAQGNGGAIYANGASVTVDDGQFGPFDGGEGNTYGCNTAKNGGVVYANTGTVTVSGGTMESNTASTGNGGAVYAGSGNVTVSGGSIANNSATASSGGAVYAGTGNVILSDEADLSDNTAKTNGGAVYAGGGSVTVSCESLNGNTATDGKGGAVYAESGAVAFTGVAVSGNTAGSDGGAVYAGSGAVTVTESVFGGDTAGDGNTAGGSGGAVYAGSGNVTVSGGSMQNNKSTSGNGGALYVGSGAATMETATLTDNSSAAGKGGAVYLDSGSLTLTTVTATGNSAINGSAVFTNTGRASFSAGSYTGNVATEGGAVGVKSKDARLVFTGDVQVKDNTLGTADDAPKSNVYLDQDDDAVINIDTLGSSAAIGIYVPDAVVPTRSVPGARFAVYTSNSNANKITNDRYPLLTVQSDTSAKKLYWGNSIKVSVHKLDSYGSDFTQPANSGAGTQLGKYDAYFPEFSDAAVSELASELVIKYKLDIGTKVYAGAYLDGERSFGDYITKLTWVKEKSEWYVTTRSGAQVSLTKPNGNYRIYIYYAEPAYLSIENNTDMALTISDMTVGGTSVINSETVAGYGMVFAKNGAIRSALLPVTAEDLQLSAGQSINLLIPGGRNKAYTLDGSFETTTGGSVRLRRGAETSLSEETVTVSATDGTFEQLTGTTLNAAGTYNIIFGSNKIICKVVDAGGVEHPYSKISDAIADIVATTGTNPPYTLATAKTAAIEMVTDYLLTASDDVNIPQGYDITLTTAAKGGATYCYNGSGDRATISRDTLNTDSMIKGWNALENNKVVTTLRLKNIIFDGKSVRGSSDGGAVATQYTDVYIDTVDFKNVYASNGGALLVMFNFDKRPDHTKDAQNTLPGTVLEVKDSDFTGCTSTTTVKSNRLGGGAIVTNAETMTLEDCDFTNCTSVDQAGAVFHRVDKNNSSWTNVTGCTFTNCSANAAGGLEIDSKTINVTNCRFEHCVAKERNGGGFNVYALNAATPTADCWVTVSDCTFNDCQLTTTNTSNGNGGGFRCNAVYTKVINSTFTNNLALYGGGFCISNGSAKKGEVYGCTFERNTANQGGGIFGKPKEFIIGDGYYYLDSDQKAVSVLLEDGVYKDLSGNPITDDAILESIQAQNTEIKSCTSVNEGGGVYQARDESGSSLSITNASITGNRTTANGKNGGGVFTNARTVTIAGSAITDNTSTNLGGGVYANTYTSLSITDSNISRNIASSNGGGVWFYYKDQNNALTIKGSTFDGNTSNNGSGGGIYTEAKTVTVGASETRTDSEGKAIRSSISNNTVKTNGGGIYQSRNVNDSKLKISDTSVSGNKASNGSGGGVYAGVRTLEITSAEISRNSATSDGGGVWFYIKDTGASMALTVEGSTLDSNTSGSNGGSVYTIAKTVDVKAHTEGNEVTKSEISGSTAAKNGGGIYQNLDVEGSMLTISGAIISNNTANGTGNNELGGGGVYANVRNMTLTDSEVSGNTAAKYGGGIYKNSEGNDRYLIVDNTKVQNNTAGNQGGGVYDKSHLTLRNGSEITGNRLNNNTAANCAGVYLVDGRTLFVGPDNATAGQSDTVIVRNNTTANGTFSDLRLWETSGENNAESVYVYCNLTNDSEIRVVNAAKAGTQFGSAQNALTNGFSDDNYVFIADSSTLHGITKRDDATNKTIIWAGPPIAKLTDGNGRLLYIKYYEGTGTYEETGTYPAIFDRLDNGINNEGSTVSPFSMLRMDELTLYYRDGTTYSGTDYCIKMLVEHYETSADMTLPYVEGRTVTFTTAEKSFPSDWPYTDDMDTYHFEGKAGGRATVIRGSSVASNRTLLNVRGTLKIENIVLDGGTENGVTVSNSTRCVYIDNANCTVTLGENAVLQNGKVNGYGGGVNLNNGTLNIEGGVIRNCTANNSDGGGVYLNVGQLLLEAGRIYQCTAATGGGVRTKNGTFTMTGGTIQGCSSTSTSSGGGGVCIAGGQKMYMSGGSIINNSAQKTGGGIMVYSNASRLYFSGKVNISGNTSEASKATNKACNVELNYDSNDVINTNNGGLNGGSYIGVYVPDGASYYDKHGVERKPFGTFADGDNTTNFYSFVNDRNGLKGGIIENPSPNTIYWIQIFSLKVSKEVLSSDSNPADTDETFSFTVHIRGNATATGQLNAAQIDSSTGYYGGMTFESNGRDTTTATFTLKAGESMTAVNLSQGLDYEVIENLTDEQKTKYATLPATVYTGTIGENRGSTGKDPYTSVVKYINVLPVCKITKPNGDLLYVKYTYNENDAAKTFYVPAVYTDLTGNDGAFKALESKTFYQSKDGDSTYQVSGGVQIKMLTASYTQKEAIELPSTLTGTVTLTTAGASDSLFPKRDSGTASTIVRGGFEGASMFTASGKLVLTNIILDGAKRTYTSTANGGIVNVPSGGSLTVQTDALLQNSTTSGNGGAIYVDNGGTMTLTGGKIWKNEVTSESDGAGIYLAYDSATNHGTLNISGNPGFGKVMSQGSFSSEGNYKQEELIGSTNGGTDYTKPRQDIYIAGYQSDSDDDTSAASLVIKGDISSGDGNIWVWAAESPHYKSTHQFAKIEEGMSISVDSLKAFRNARDDTTAGNNTGNHLYGITKDGKNVLWNGKPVCKLTDSNNVLLYERMPMGSGYVYNPAVYSTVAEGFSATENALYHNSAKTRYNGALKLKMLQDYELDSGEANITYGTARDLTFTTAEIRSNNSDGYYYSPATGATGDSLTKATLTKAQSTASMFTVNTTFNSFMVKDLIFDGGTSVMTAENVNGGAFNITNVTSATFSGVTFNKLNATGNGGAINYSGTTGTLTFTGDTFTDCYATGDGGAVYTSAATASITGSTVNGHSTLAAEIANANSGGAVYVAAGSLTMDSGSIQNCTATNGGAVYVAANATMEMTGGTINGNSATDDGAGIYLDQNATLKLSGSPSFGGTGTDPDGNLISSTVIDKETGETEANGNFVTKPYGEMKNGGKDYPEVTPSTDPETNLVRQDVFVTGTGTPLASIVVTGNLESGDGSIWVWAGQDHCEMLKQFATIQAGVTLSDSSYKVFRNAQDDVTTRCGGSYLTGQKGEVETYIYWTGGFDVFFTKNDGFGRALTGAVFGLYTDSNCTTVYQKNGASVTATSAKGDGTEKYKDKSGVEKTLTKGQVLFDKVPTGVYYMKETNQPTTTEGTGSNTYTLTWKNDNTYILLVGEANLTVPTDITGTPWATGKVLEKITTNDIEAQTGTGEDEKQYAIFRIDPTTGQAVATPDIATYGILNISTAGRKVILRKVDSSSYEALPGAHFHLYRADLSEVTEGRPTGQTYYESGVGGAWFIGTLPCGKYYVLETLALTGYSNGKVYELTVQKNATTGKIETTLNAGPEPTYTATTPETKIIEGFLTKMKELATTPPAGDDSDENP